MDSPLVSPAKARQAAIQAKDWAYVNSWLSRQYAPNPVPKFERNDDTLRTLLALAAANDAADEEATLIQHAREQTIRGFKARENTENKQKVEILDEVEHCLDEDGTRNLEDLAETVVLLSSLETSTKEIGQSIIELTREEFNIKEQMTRVEMLHDYLKRELATLREQLEDFRSNPAFETPANLPTLTSEWTRSTKLLTPKVGEYQDRVAASERTKNKGATLEDVMADEEEVSRMIESVKGLESRVNMFHDLPRDLAGARAKYRELEAELNKLTRKRDSMFEGLVER
ncbi:hypothetical protein P175DRAFT_0485348 [Aspergillus ochraceoroseus IBT 24754]|uniref:HAUS augmin-like complex subunit 1 n=3 Tax=Aspergillus subgen. Nidulantes TaxID=2720870 RepID=A0A0F8VVJ6_9EURO|nr:uncharacterized protein P175DRAFT_0485348 [Aspergillus ochraceoroseus IBT 24754]KKK25037.1 hypothetical protein AOCH_003064 [Aspergillus ochraceoroseus]KKK27271.1 hypothetical protein ARAM_002248 [Aspergillus rambellii]PTU18166.1 hypothetical protein P175DRAFT_0485348 [Aspergillus ochraceoroseus IBT 24754]